MNVSDYDNNEPDFVDKELTKRSCAYFSALSLSVIEKAKDERFPGLGSIKRFGS